MTRLTTILLAAIVLCSWTGASAKPAKKDPVAGVDAPFYFGLRFGGAFPRGDFKRATPAAARVALDLGWWPRGLPFSMGFVITGGGGFQQGATVDDTHTIGHSTLFGFAGGYVRASPFRGLFRPFVEGALGLRVLSTTLDAKECVLNLGGDLGVVCNVIYDESFRHAALGYNVAAGVQFQIPGWALLRGTGEPVFAFIDLRVGYAGGGEATYAPVETVTIDVNNNVTYEPARASAELIFVSVGLSLPF